MQETLALRPVANHEKVPGTAAGESSEYSRGSR